MSDEVTRTLEAMLNAAVLPVLHRQASLQAKARRARAREQAQRLRNRDAIPEPRPSKPLPGQRTLFNTEASE